MDNKQVQVAEESERQDEGMATEKQRKQEEKKQRAEEKMQRNIMGLEAMVEAGFEREQRKHAEKRRKKAAKAAKVEARKHAVKRETGIVGKARAWLQN